MAFDATVRSICFACANTHGAVWPQGHAATVWTGTCDACGKAVAVCDVSDWNWPKGKKLATFSLQNRD